MRHIQHSRIHHPANTESHPKTSNNGVARRGRAREGCVTVVEDVDSLKLEEIGPGFEHHANFPERINTEFVQVVR